MRFLIRFCFFLLPFFVLFTCIALSGEGFEELGNRQETGVKHTVEKGDTLWDISGRFLNEHKKWPELWKKNKHIVNPNLIYPGNSIYVPGSVLDAALSEKKAEYASYSELQSLELMRGANRQRGMIPLSGVGAVGKNYGNEETVRLSISVSQPPKVIKSKMLASCGFISKDKDINKAVITGSKYKRGLYYSGTKILAQDAELKLEPGALYSIFRYGKEIYHPVTKKLLGTLVSILGESRVISKTGEVSELSVVNSYDYLGIGDFLMPFVGLGSPKKIVRGSNALDGTIVDGYGDRDSFVEGDFIYIDRGLSSGLLSGQVLTIYRIERDYDTFGVSNRGAGEIEVGTFISLLVSENSSTGFILRSTEAVEVGFLVR